VVDSLDDDTEASPRSRCHRRRSVRQAAWVQRMLAAAGIRSSSAGWRPPGAALAFRAGRRRRAGRRMPTRPARLFETARASVTVLLDGQGMDEQWAGYSYYLAGAACAAGIVQGRATALRPNTSGGVSRWQEAPSFTAPFDDPVRNLQYATCSSPRFRARSPTTTAPPRASTGCASRSSITAGQLAVRQPAARIAGGERNCCGCRVWMDDGLVSAPSGRSDAAT
jgi:hypothetical protein